MYDYTLTKPVHASVLLKLRVANVDLGLWELSKDLCTHVKPCLCHILKAIFYTDHLNTAVRLNKGARTIVNLTNPTEMDCCKSK